MTVTLELPRWDMTVVYPSLQSEEFNQGCADLVRRIEALWHDVDRFHIDGRPDPTVDDETVRAFDVIMPAFNDLSEQLVTVGAYISAFVASDSRDAVAQAAQSELRQRLVEVSKLDTRLTAWIGSLDVEELVRRSDLASRLAYRLQRTHTEATHLMPLPVEDLAGELSLTGGSAWSRLYNDVTSQLVAEVETGDGSRPEPIAVVRNMAFDPDRAVRERAYRAEVAAWESVATPVAAALNSVKGETNTLGARRHWASALDLALFNNSIDRETLDAMMEAARAAFPDFRRYLQAKAHALGLERLAWFDLFAPLGRIERSWSFDEAHRFLVDRFAGYSTRLSEFVDRAFRECWIDAEPRAGKRGGAFCMALRGEESRVLTNYMPTYDGVSTLAHELGHAYHNYVKAPRLQLQRATPMTLAETASIFCETLIEHASLEGADTQEQIAILEQSLQGACQVVVDITSRFIFERTVFERRRQRELAIAELNQIMLEAQRQTYGDGLDQNTLHPYMWVAKGHYYSVDRPFYNFPYMFGLLFGLGLYARYERDPEGFRRGYDDLLSSTGMADAATLGERFGIDIRRPAFWTSSLDVVRGNIERFERLTAGESPAR